jgi:hypothetical protein
MDKTFAGEDIFDLKRLGKWEAAMQFFGLSSIVAWIPRGGEDGTLLGSIDSGMLCGYSLEKIEEIILNEETQPLSEFLRKCAETVWRASPASLLEDL